MENIYKKMEKDPDSLSLKEKKEIFKKLRDEVDKIDEELVELLNQRTLHSVLIGRIKQALNLPTYSPEREKEIAEKIKSYLREPLTEPALQRIYERIIDESRTIQQEEARGKKYIYKKRKSKNKRNG
jgi:chorismate mutase